MDTKWFDQMFTDFNTLFERMGKTTEPEEPKKELVLQVKEVNGVTTLLFAGDSGIMTHPLSSIRSLSLYEEDGHYVLDVETEEDNAQED